MAMRATEYPGGTGRLTSVGQAASLSGERNAWLEVVIPMGYDCAQNAEIVRNGAWTF